MTGSRPWAVILGAGYVGGALAQRLLAGGWEVGALTRNEGAAARLRAWGCGPVAVADLAGDGWHGQWEAGGVDLVVNTVSSAGGGVAGYRHSYVEGNRSIGRWCAGPGGAARGRGGEAGRGGGVFVYTSSTSVYPQADGGWVEEGQEAAEAGSAAAALLEAEEVVRTEVAPWFGRACVLRLAGIYGPGRHHYLDRLRAGERNFPGNGEDWLNLIYREDAVRAVESCAREDAAGPVWGVFNVCDGNPVRRGDMLAWLAARLGLERPEFAGSEAADRRGRGSAGGQSPNRRVSPARFQEATGWRPQWADFRAGYAAILGGDGSLLDSAGGRV